MSPAQTAIDFDWAAYADFWKSKHPKIYLNDFISMSHKKGPKQDEDMARILSLLYKSYQVRTRVNPEKLAWGRKANGVS